MKKVSIDYGNIPQVMKDMDRWACFDVADGNKKPYTPGTSQHARPNDVSTLSSFEEAVADVANGVRDHIAFCFQEDDPWVFLDLDHTDDEAFREEHQELLDWFPSYTERSVSGKGMHIVIKGKLDGEGLAEEHIQISDKNRFCIMTGHIIKKRAKIRIGNTQKLGLLQDKIRKSRNQGFSFPLEEKEWDYQNIYLFYAACCKVFKRKFINLYHGEWTQYKEYTDRVGRPDQSKADHALMSMMCELTESNELVRYAFAMSAMFRDWKGGGRPETYIDRTIQKYRDKVMNEALRRERARELAEENLKKEEERMAKAKKSVKKKTTKKAKKTRTVKKTIDLDEFSDDEIMTEEEIARYDFNTDKIDEIPSKLHRMLAKFFLKNARLPNQDIAILCANVVVTSIKQRAYLTPSDAGCNLSFWLVAETGKGKDIFTRCMDMISSRLANEVPHFSERIVGKFASGEAMETVLSKMPMFISKVPEAGAWWRKVVAPNRPPHIDALNEGILNLTMSTDPDGMWRCRKKAKQDDELKATIFRAAGSFYGESTFADLFGDLDIHSVGTGLMQRQIFCCLEDIPFVEENSSRQEMSHELKELLIEHIQAADDLDITNTTCKVKASKKAYMMIKDFVRSLRLETYDKDSDALKNDYMNRTGLKIWRYASHLACGDSADNPIMYERHAEYAIKYVMEKDEYMLNKFNSGEVGKGQLKQESDMLKLIRSVIKHTEKKRRMSHRFPPLVAQEKTLVTYAYLKNRAKRLSCFQSDAKGALTAIDNCIDNLCKSGALSRLTNLEAQDEYDTTTKLLRYNGEG